MRAAGPAWQCCPRSALCRALEAAAQQAGLSLKVGFESEFYLLDKAKAHPGALPPPIDDSCYCQTTGLDAAAAGGQRG